MSYLSLAQTQAPVVEPPEEVPPSLATVQVPPVPGIDQYIRDRQAAIVLGKSLFWDINVGSDGKACASCHFHAGADNRIKNQLNPNLLNENTAVAAIFDPTASGGQGGPNYTMVRADFPFHQFFNPNDRNSGVRFTTNDVLSSQGTFNGEFVSIEPRPGSRLEDQCNTTADPVFNVNGIGTRKVEPRHTPTTINAAFNFRNFWDGRANNRFNGIDEFGDRNVRARILVSQSTGALVTRRISLRNSSLASQAVGPPLSTFESACAGRTWGHIARKLLQVRALVYQDVSPTDSALGPFRHPSGKGLSRTYRNLIMAAFNPNLWQATGPVNGIPGLTPSPNGGAYPPDMQQIEYNFSLFFGLAVQAYEQTLISDKAKFDKYREGTATLTPDEQAGLEVFMNQGKCVNCHKGPDFTGAGLHLQAENQEGGLVERMIMRDGGVALYDNGFYNISVTPTRDDVSLGRFDPFGNPFSFTEQYRTQRFVDPFEVNPCTFEVPFNSADCSFEPPPGQLANERVAVRGAFKTPGLRNVELTGPYMHNGSMASLREVVQFYNRGGNFGLNVNPEKDPDIEPLGLTSQQQAQLVSFLRTLTDPRVRSQKAPFDHPSIRLFNGHPGDENAVAQNPNNPQIAADTVFVFPAVGAQGGAPLPTFEQKLGGAATP